MPDGLERPVAYASRSLTPAEKNYSQIDKEALAITWGVKRFNTYLFGRHFKLITDHQPLISIFNPQKGISNTSAARLQRQALFLAGYDYEIVYKNTKKHGNADGLSRLPMRNSTPMYCNDETEDDEIEILHIQQFEKLPIKAAKIRTETRRDSLLSQVYNFVMNGWKDERSLMELNPYFTRRHELTVHQECLLWGVRVIIPTSLRTAVLQELHEGHIGVVKVEPGSSRLDGKGRVVT